MRRKIITIILAVITFTLALGMTLYPVISNYVNEKYASEIHTVYEEVIQQADNSTLREAKELAIAYNESIVPGTAGEAYSQAALLEASVDYEAQLNIAGNGTMGYVEIPKISVSLIIYHTIEENVLQKGIGHVPESHLPVGGKNTHCVLAGHTGLPSAKLLTNIDHLKVGDRFYIHVLNEVLEYKIDDVSVVEPDEVSRLNVISGKDCVTLVTCTPYGVNSHRLLVRGVRVDGSDLSAKEDGIVNELLNIDMKYLITFSLIGLFIIFIAVKKLRDIRKKKTATTNEGGEKADENTP